MAAIANLEEHSDDNVRRTKTLQKAELHRRWSVAAVDTAHHLKRRRREKSGGGTPYGASERFGA